MSDRIGIFFTTLLVLLGIYAFFSIALYAVTGYWLPPFPFSTHISPGSVIEFYLPP